MGGRHAREKAASLSTRRGFTVIEALIAIVVLIVAMLALLGTVTVYFQYASRDGVRMQAASAAQQYLDSLHQYVQHNGTNSNLPAAAALTVDEGDQYMGSNSPMPSPTAGPITFGMTNNGCPAVAGSSRMYDCQVTVSWTQDNQPDTLTVESYVTSEN